MGWDDDQWTTPLSDDTTSISGKELISDLMGNAFSIFHMGPWHMALLASWGKFSEADGPQADAPDAPCSGDDDSDPESVNTDDLESD